MALLALVGCFVASYLALYKLGYIGQLSCAIGSCERVNTSRWAVFLGAPVALWGVAFYLAVFAVAVIGSLPRYSDEPGVSVLLTSVSLAGVLFTAYLTSLELFAIHAFCVWCVVSACVVTAIFVVSALDLREIRCNTT